MEIDNFTPDHKIQDMLKKGQSANLTCPTVVKVSVKTYVVFSEISSTRDFVHVMLTKNEKLMCMAKKCRKRAGKSKQVYLIILFTFVIS